MSERQGLPSASGLERLSRCPGSFRLEQGQPDTSSAESESGTRIHAWLAGEAKFDTLTEDEKELGQLCETQAARLVAHWEKGIEGGGEITYLREQRIWYPLVGEKLMSGKGDLLAFKGGHAIYLDYKTGRGAVENAAENMQLRALAVLAKVTFKLESVTVGIVQPLAGESIPCKYEPQHLDEAEDELLTILDAANKPDAPLIPGDQQCKYCKAALICPARRKEFEQLAVTTIHETGLTVSNEELAQLRDKCGPAKKLIALIEKECFERAQQDPESWRALGWEMTTPKGRSEIADMPAVAAKLNEFGVPWDAISAKCKMSKGSVKDLLRPVVKGKDITLKDAEWSVLKGNTAEKEGKPRLVRIGAGEDEDNE